MQIFSTVLDVTDKLTRDAFIKLIIEWNQGSPHSSNVIPGIKWNGETNIRYGDEDMWLGIEECHSHNVVAIRYEKKEEDGIIWDTDCVVNFDTRKMAVRLDRSYTADALESSPRFSTPHFINLLIARGFIKDDRDLPVLNTATVIDENNVEILINLINGNTQYGLPVVYVSKTFADKDPVNVSYLAGRLKGVAHVLVEKSEWLNEMIRKRCDWKNEYNGAIGIYYPNRARGNKKYMYRSAVGYDDFLLERVIRAVIQYNNAQLVDPLLTWHGVNYALARERMAAQLEGRLAAEAARRRAEAQTTRILNTLDEKEREIRKQASDDARFEANTILDSFDDDMRKLQDQIDSLTRENETLQAENQGLRVKYDQQDSTPVLVMGDEFEFYPGEIKDLLLSTLTGALKDIPAGTRRSDVIKDIIKNNDYQKISETRAEELKRVMRNYDGMSSKNRSILKSLGFEITEEGKHYKVSYYGDSRYQTTYAKTPSDGRSGKNSAQNTINMAF